MVTSQQPLSSSRLRLGWLGNDRGDFTRAAQDAALERRACFWTGKTVIHNVHPRKYCSHSLTHENEIRLSYAL